MTGPVIETERLILRLPQPSDFEAWAQLNASEAAQRFLGGPLTREMAWRNMATMSGGWLTRGFSMFSVIEKGSGQWIGRLGPWQPEGWPGTEVGWGLSPDAWGKGYATEGAAAAIDWAFDTLGWDEVIHTIDPMNTPSVAVAKRLGSVLLRRAHLPAPLDFVIDVWGQSREDWRMRRRA
ncbi:GNAT family N-acetyltransferase [Phenylobacterium immobile]|uniref:GNAT family N-acetyltransferase n=1 Tax=Phenylobacterium immobile TaxID=21 RepID=UPI000A51E09C|nr:GNAT family N-acetyltransferase [Phenylobacterium immobile]